MKVCLSIYRALFIVNKALLRDSIPGSFESLHDAVYRALFIVYRALLSVFRVLLKVCTMLYTKIF